MIIAAKSVYFLSTPLKSVYILSNPPVTAIATAPAVTCALPPPLSSVTQVTSPPQTTCH